MGPEDPLCAGVVDALDAAGIPAFGPTQAAAELEGSKVFMKMILSKYGIPTATYEPFEDPAAAIEYIKNVTGAPVVVKTDGLAGGKGAIVCMTMEEALKAVDDIMVTKAFGEKAGKRIVVEEFLEGEEASFFALCDGETAIPLIFAQDHKRVGDGDTGLNTGGMGAYSPCPVSNGMEDEVMQKVMIPTIEGMKKEGKTFKGVLFAGLMITADKQIKVLEHNIRFGDPECQVVMSRMKSDIVPVLYACAVRF